MIPSDHFVRFYNGVFKFLDENGGLEDYYQHISTHQEFHCLELFREKGLPGIYEYYLKIRKEENCDLDIELKEHELRFFMRKCPSLSKAIDNDAGVCSKYCFHCPGWLAPLLKKAGLYLIYDIISPELPQCRMWIFDDREYAENARKKVDSSTIECNF